MNHYERKSSHNKTVFAIIPAIVILALLFSLQGCIWIPRSAYYNDIAKETVTSIDIFDVRKNILKKKYTRYELFKKNGFFAIEVG